MSTGNNIPAFTAADILRYHQGLLSNKERNAMEKAALDDPFLADALEGYSTPDVDLDSDMSLLNKQLAKRIQEEDEIPVIPLARKTNTIIPLLRAAAVFVFIAGASLLIYQFGFKRSSDKEEIAMTPVVEKIKDTTATPLAPKDTTPSAIVSQEMPGMAKPVVQAPPVVRERADDLTVNSDVTPPVSESKEIASAPVGNSNANVIRGFARNAQAGSDSLHFGISERNINNAAKKKALSRQAQIYLDKAVTYRGQVVNQDNQGLPFANVTNVKDQVGTYTDANGNFILTSTEPALDVQVRSVGFANKQYRLEPKDSAHQIRLSEDKSVAAQTLSNQKVNAAKRLQNNMQLEGETEPEDGWDNYDSYLANNLNFNDEVLQQRQNSGSSVEVSFQVNSLGEPINIRVEKSLCTKCDQEAIRLVKEGPRFKRKSKKARTKVTIAF